MDRSRLRRAPGGANYRRCPGDRRSSSGQVAQGCARSDRSVERAIEGCLWRVSCAEVALPCGPFHIIERNRCSASASSRRSRHSTSRAFDAGAPTATSRKNTNTIASGLRVPRALGDFPILRALREGGGFALETTDEAIDATRSYIATRDGLQRSPEGAAIYAAFAAAASAGRIRASDEVVFFNYATASSIRCPACRGALQIAAMSQAYTLCASSPR